MEIATLAVQVDSRSVKSAESDLRGLTSAGQQAERSMGGVSSSSNQASQALERQSNAARQLTAVVRQYAQIAMGAFSAQQIMRSADAWQQMQNRLRLVTSSTQELARATDEVFKISQRTSASMDATAQVFQRFAQNSTQLGISLDKVSELTETVSKAVAISGATAGAAEAALMQFGQALAAGALRGEELNSVLEQTPGLAQAIAVGMGVAVGSLKELAQEGRITGEVMVEALTNARNFVDDQFSTRIKTLSDHFVELGNASTRLIGELNESTGATQALGRGIEFLTENLSTAASVVGTLMAAHLANWLKNITMRAVAAGSAFTVLTRAVSTLAGGPLGLVITAIGLGATAWQVFGRDAENALEAASRGVLETNNGLDAMLEKFKELNIVQQRMAIAEKQDALSQATKAASEALDELIGKVALAEGTRGAPRIRAAFSEALQGIVEDTEASSGEVAQSIMDLVDKMVSGSKLGEPYRQQLLAQIQAYIDLRSRISQYSAELSGMQAILEDVRRSLTGTNDALSDQQRALGEFMKTYATSSERMAAELEKWDKALGGLTGEQRQRIIDRFTPKVRRLAEKLTEAEKAQQAFERERQQALRAQYSAISAIHEEARGIEDQVALYGMSRTAIEDLTIARLEEQAALLSGRAGAEEQLEIFEREIEARKRLRAAIGSMEQKEAERAAWESWARDVETIFDQVGQSLTDAIFEGGKSGRDLLKDLFKTLTFRVLIQPVMGQMQGWVTNSLGGMFGYQNPQQGGGGFSFGGGSTFGAGAVSDLGGWMAGSSVQSVSDLGAKMVMSADKIAQIGGNVLGYGSAIYDLSQGKYASAALTAAGQAIGGPPLAMAGNFVGGIIDGLFDREPTTRREQRTQVEYAGGIFDVTKVDDRAPAGADAAARALAEQAVATANDIFKQVGVDAAIDSFHAIMASSYKGDRDGVASGGRLRLGDQLIDFGIDLNDPNPTIQGFGGWSDAPTLPRLATDIQLSVLEAFQSVGDQLPGVLSSMLEGIDVRSLGEQEAQALAERFTAVTQGASQFLAAIETMPFAELRDLSFDAAAGMVQFAGGIDNLLTAQQTYYERFYSEQEQFEHSVDLIGKALAGVGVEMPALIGSTDDMLASYRALVESLDLNTEAGQQAYVTLMQTAGAFADVAQFAGQAAAELERAAEEQRRLAEEQRRLDEQEAARRAAEMQALRQSFVGLAGDALAAIQQHGQERIAKLSESFGRTDAILNSYRTQVRQLESQWGSLITTMQRSMRDLRGQVEETARLQYNQARAVISTALLTGKLPQTADLGEAIRVAQQGVTGGRYASEFDQREAYLKLANELEALQGIAQPELDTARASLAQLEKQYNRLRGIEDLSGLSLKQLEKQFAVALSAEEAARTQIAQIERQIAMAQLQYQQLVGINDELSTLPGALRALAKAIDAASRVPAESTAVNREARYLANNPDVLAAYVRGDWGVQTAEEAARYHWEKYGKYEGRSFDVGTPYVPYDMMANIHRGEIIIDPRSSDILRRYGIEVQGGGISRETEQLLREQLAEVRRQNHYLYEIVKSGRRTDRNTEEVANAIAHGDSDGGVVVVM